MKDKIFLLILTLVFIGGCLSQQTKDVTNLTPKEVVGTYYNSFDTKDYATMYALISDGFKEIEPTAKDLETFSQRISKYFETGNGIKIKEVEEISNDGSSATVDYTLEMDLFSGKKELRSTFTIKKRANGWKLIHPYGDKIDLS